MGNRDSPHKAPQTDASRSCRQILPKAFRKRRFTAPAFVDVFPALDRAVIQSSAQRTNFVHHRSNMPIHIAV
jgi:hypothetical protein